MKIDKISRYVLFFLSGSIVLTTCSIVQKLVILGDSQLAFNPIAYVIPVIFGGCVGITISHFMQKVMFLNNQLRNRVEDLEKILPICSVCKKVCINPEADERDRKWVNANQYVLSQKLTHGYCNDCYEKTLKDFPKQKEKFDQEQERVNISA